MFGERSVTGHRWCSAVAAFKASARTAGASPTVHVVFWGRAANDHDLREWPKPTSAMSACAPASANAWAVAWSGCCSARPNRGLAMGAAPVHGLPSPTPSRSSVQHVAPGAGVQSAPANGQLSSNELIAGRSARLPRGDPQLTQVVTRGHLAERRPFHWPSSISAFGSIALGRTFDRIDRAAMCRSPVRHLLRRCRCPKAQAVRQPAHR